MKPPKADLFVQERRQEKLVQFKGVLMKLANW